MVYSQGPTPLKFNKTIAHGILTGVLKQTKSKVMDMLFYWLRYRSIEQKKHTHWKHGKHNLGDYPKTYHSDKHDRTVLPFYVANAEKN